MRSSEPGHRALVAIHALRGPRRWACVLSCDFTRMKVDPQSVYVGMGAVGTVAGVLGLWRRRLARIFALSLAGFRAFELLCFLTGLNLLVPVWWAVHMPSAIALGADEILE